MKIDKIAKVWSNLEDAYLSKGGKISRSEFLEMLISYKSDGTHNISYLLKCISDDVALYTDEKRMNDYTVLSSMFKELSNFVDSNGVPNNITNLNEFLVSIIVTEVELDYSALNNLYNCNKDTSIAYPYSRMISNFGCVTSYSYFCKDTTVGKGRSAKVYKGYELEEEKFKVINCNEYQKYISDNISSPYEFSKACAVLIAILHEDAKLPVNLFITDSSNIVGGKLFTQKVKQVEISEGYGYKFIKYDVCDFSVYVVC